MRKSYYMIIIIVTITLLLASSVLSVMHIRQITRQDFYTVNHQLIDQTTKVFEVWMRDQLRLVDSISKDQRIIDLCLDPLNEDTRRKASDYLYYLHGEYEYYENLPIAIKTDQAFTLQLSGKDYTIEDGEFIIDTVNNETIGKGGLDYSYVHQIFQGKPYYISEIYPSIWRNNPIIVISSPVIYQEKIIGVAFVSPQMDYFSEFFIDSIRLGDTGYMFMVDQRGDTIAHFNRDFILSDSIENRNFVMTLIENFRQSNNYFQATYNGTNKFYLGEKINLDERYLENELYIVVTQNKSEIFANVHRFAAFSIFITLVLSFILFKTYQLVSKVQIQDTVEKELVIINDSLETQIKKRTEALEDMANRDSLTSLYHHRYIHDKLKRLVAESSDNEQIVIAIIDIDDFKEVNDQCGHQVGDEVIQRVSELLTESVRESDIVGRYGGEEFMIIFNDISLERCIAIAERIRVTIESESFSCKGRSITVSIGLASKSTNDVNQLVKLADDNMYVAKRSGKNQVKY